MNMMLHDLPATAVLPAEFAAPVALLPPREDPERLSDDELVARIVEEHHASARRALPLIVTLLAKVAGFYRRRNPKLSALCDAGEELAERLIGGVGLDRRFLEQRQHGRTAVRALGIHRALHPAHVR